MSNGDLKSCPYVKRSEYNPVFTAKDVPFPCDLTFNAGVIRWQGKYVMIFRNDYNYLGGTRFEGTNIGLATSEDGIHWTCKPDPVFAIKDEEINRIYDPRLTIIEGQPYTTFAIDTKHGLLGGIASTDDFEHFNVITTTLPDNRNLVLFPERINGLYYRLERPMPIYSRGHKDRFDIWISSSPDMVYWGNSRLVCGVEDFPFANDKIGPGAPPIKTNRGWLVMTHAVDIDPERGKNGWEDKWTKRYCAGMMLLDLETPSKVLGIYKQPLLAPETDYESVDGFRTQVIFPTGLVQEDDGICRIYYGAADTVVALAEARTEDLVDLCLGLK